MELKHRSIVALSLLALAGASHVTAQAAEPAPPAPAAPQADADYAAYLAKFKSGTAVEEAKARGEPHLAGLELRTLYSRTSRYAPYSDPSMAALGEAMAFRDKGAFRDCADKAKAALDLNYTNIAAHRLAGGCAASAGGQQDEVAPFAAAYVHLLMSIIREPGRNGLTPDTAYRVISVPEEYAVLGYLGLRKGTQSLITTETGRSVDLIEVDSDNPQAPKTIYFDVTKVMGALEKSMSPAAPPPPGK